VIPVGVFANGFAVAAGGVLGAIGARHLPKQLFSSLTPVLGFCAIAIGIVNIVKLESLPVVALSLIVGTLLGEMLSLDDRAEKALAKFGSLCKELDRNMYLSVVVLFCASGTGIFGSLHAGMSDDHSILYTKAVLDFFTAFTFAMSLGISISAIAIAQVSIQIALFYFATLLMTDIDPTVMANFQAVGGLLTFAIGINILKLKELKVLNYTPALLIALPLTRLWQTIM